jgi:hypothetical protein
MVCPERNLEGDIEGGVMRRLVGVLLVALLVSSCSQEPDVPRSAPLDLPASLSQDPYDPDIDPASFTNEIDNPYLPYEPGAKWTYEGESEDGTETIVVEVTERKKRVMGIDVVVVRDEVKLDGERIELTYDWYAQDDDGNVWYMGEDSAEYEDGKKINTEGSWEAGKDGALPGIVMPADPAVGQSYRQEYYEGEAEDTGEVIEVGESVKVPAGSFEDVVVTEDLNPFEPKVVENKYFAKGVGLVMEEKVKGGEEKVELLDYEG